MFKLMLVLCSVAIACHGLNAELNLDKDSVIVVDGPDATVETRSSLFIEDSNLYYAYSRDNMQVPVTVTATKSSITASPILVNRPTIILVHGHGANALNSLNPVVKDAILRSGNFNVVALDWSVYARLSYSVAVSVVPQVAANLAEFITLLVQKDRANLEDMHLIGHGLGAHIVGIAARSVQKGQIARITGLDPAGSQWGSNSARLRINDARYVEVIHTDGGGLLSKGIGTPLGNVDFFVNGGSNQPGCITHLCNHDRAFELFAASMVNPGLVGYPCSSNAQLSLNRCNGLPLRMGGLELFKNGAGVYRINTKRNYPF